MAGRIREFALKSVGLFRGLSCGMAKQKTMTPEELQQHLAKLQETIISNVLDAEHGVGEGKVMTDGAAPYRRLDCDGKALAYVRCRPKKKAVRIDVTGLWKAPRSMRLRVPNAGGAATLLLKTATDARYATQFLLKCVEQTRMARTKKQAPRRPFSEPRPDRPA